MPGAGATPSLVGAALSLVGATVALAGVPPTAAASAGAPATASADAATTGGGDGTGRRSVVAGDLEAEILYRIHDPAIAQASGLAVAPVPRARGGRPPVVYVMEDAGTGSTDVFAVGPTGDTLLTVEVPVGNDDWEDIALGTDEAGDPAIFIADTGDDHFARVDAGLPGRTEFAVIRMRRPTVDVEPGSPSRAVPATDVRRWRFVYADGASHNAESLLVEPATNRILVIDKTEEPGRAALLWAAPAQLDPDGVNVFEAIGRIPLTGASGGAFSTDGTRMVVRNDDTALIWSVPDGDLASALADEPETVALPDQRQGEGIDFTSDGRALVVNSEGRNQPVYRVPIPSALARPVRSTPADELDRERGGAWRMFGAAGSAAVAGVALVRHSRNRAERGSRVGSVRR